MNPRADNTLDSATATNYVRCARNSFTLIVALKKRSHSFCFTRNSTRSGWPQAFSTSPRTKSLTHSPSRPAFRPPQRRLRHQAPVTDRPSATPDTTGQNLPAVLAAGFTRRVAARSDTPRLPDSESSQNVFRGRSKTSPRRAHPVAGVLQPLSPPPGNPRLSARA